MTKKVQPRKRNLADAAPKQESPASFSADAAASELEQWADSIVSGKTKKGLASKPAEQPQVVKSAAVPSATVPAVARQASKLLMSSLLAAKAEYKDHRIVAVGRADKLVLGIEIPFVLEYVLGQSVLPLSQFYQVVGEPSSNKSAFGFELVRLFRNNGGFGYLLENESKFSSVLANSICGYPDEVGTPDEPLESLGVVPADSLQDWQTKYQYLQRQVRLAMEPKRTKTERSKGLGRVYPVLFLLDSISGKLSEEKAEKIDERGYASRDYAVEAALNQDFLKKVVGDLVGWPFVFVAINHLKKRQKMVGHGIDRQKPGGTHISFQEATELELTRIKKFRFVDTSEGAVSGEWAGNSIKIQNKKNSMGQDENSVVVDISWRHRTSPATGKPRQYTTWDWGGALIEFLLSLETATTKKKVQALVDIHQRTDGKTRLFYSKALGVSQASAVPKTELGNLLQSTPQLIDSLRDVFRITRHDRFVAGTDYMAELQKRVAKVEKKTARMTQ